MAILNKEELMGKVNSIFGEEISDAGLEILDDISDTMDDLRARAAAGADADRRVAEVDSAWRKRYRDRFFGNTSEAGEFVDSNEPIIAEVERDEAEEKQPLSYENLFTTDE